MHALLLSLALLANIDYTEPPAQRQRPSALQVWTYSDRNEAAAGIDLHWLFNRFTVGAGIGSNGTWCLGVERETLLYESFIVVRFRRGLVEVDWSCAPKRSRWIVLEAEFLDGMIWQGASRRATGREPSASVA